MSQHRQTALSFISALSYKKFDEVSSYLAEDYLWRPHPERLGGLGRPQGHNKEQFLALMKSLTNIKKWDLDTENPMKIVENEKSVVAHIHADPELINGQRVSAEYIYMIDFNDQGKIQIIDEFFDTVYLDEVSKVSA